MCSVPEVYFSQHKIHGRIFLHLCMLSVLKVLVYTLVLQPHFTMEMKTSWKNVTCPSTASKIVIEVVRFVLTSSQLHIWALAQGLCPVFSPPSLLPFIFSLMDLLLESNSTYFLWLDFLLCFLSFSHLLKTMLSEEAVSTCNTQFPSMFY